MDQYFYSTRDSSRKADLATALFKSLAPDGGLYMPASLPDLGADFWATSHELSFPQLAAALCKAVLGTLIPDQVIDRVCQEAFDFEVPLVELDPDVYALELFHGPSLAFKDFGARFMARLMSWLLDSGQMAANNVDVLVATSGDTGGAVAMGFLGTPNIRVTILFPEGRVSALQQAQLTALGQNIRAIAVKGTFDDCQRLVKQAFADTALNQQYQLTSANSINLFRLLPQGFYYAWAYSRLKDRLKNGRLVVSVPSGNFGNICSGMIMQRLGCPITHFVAGTNANDVVPRFLKSGQYEPLKTIPTISNAMDVGAPSNWERIAHLYHQDHSKIKKQLSGYAFSDEVTTLAIEQIFGLRHYALEPHAAIGYLALKTYLKSNLLATGVFLGTAHPAKFLDVMPEHVAAAVQIPDRLSALANRAQEFATIDADYEAFVNVFSH